MVTQIRFRQVLGQTHEDHTVFHVTKDRKYLTIQQLTENLCKLLVRPPKGDPLPSTHMSQEVLLHHPEKLCGRRVEHLFFDEENDSTAWWKGTVLSMVDNSKTTEENVMEHVFLQLLIFTCLSPQSALKPSEPGQISCPEGKGRPH